LNSVANIALHRLGPHEFRELVFRRLSGFRPDAGDLRVGPFPRAMTARLRHRFPGKLRPAAVLIPLVDRDDGLNVLLTYRSADLEHHAGQISFPGGRLEASDVDAESGALRETEEEIGLGREFIDVLGRLPDHVIVSGYQVTPVVGLVRPGFSLRLDPTEVAGTFEAPLQHLFDPGTHLSRKYRVGDEEFEAFDLPWQEHNIWGATAGMLLTLRQLLED
jgi:8-oxo-dGTP pyrophosphatase MutT (NUDIX family)